jgi:hypothetical protein
MTIRERVFAEFRKLPGMLGKFIGGMIAIFGTSIAVAGLKQDAQKPVVLGTIAFCAGILLFVLSSRWLSARKASAAAVAWDPKTTWRQNAVT